MKDGSRAQAEEIILPECVLPDPEPAADADEDDEPQVGGINAGQQERADDPASG